MDLSKYSKYAPFMIRLGLGFVLIWFGIDAYLNPGVWSSLIPNWILSISHLSAFTFMYLNGALEIILGILLLIGLWTRLVASITILFLVGIIITLGYNDIAVRDFGLLLAAVSLIASGPGIWSVQTH